MTVVDDARIATEVPRPRGVAQSRSLLHGLRVWMPMLALCAISGLLYTVVTGRGRPLDAALYAIVIGGTVLAFERGLFLPRLHARMRQWPTWLYVPAAEVAYVICVIAGNVVAGTLLWSVGLVGGPFAGAIALPPAILFYALGVSALMVTIVRVRDLIGTEILVSILVGRYHRPVQEERIFLFLDLVGSTAYAQRHGDLRAQEFLGAIFECLAEPVRRNRGAIDDYVGDMALITWPLPRGIRHGRCVACVFDILEAVDREAPLWQRRFGQVPAFRAALHGGAVVTAEVGVDRHKIAYFGDVVNTTGRLEALCRTLDAPILISSDLYDRLEAVPHGIAVRPLGVHPVKGRGQELAVLALEPATPL
jgi:adenylate cyclase